MPKPKKRRPHKITGTMKVDTFGMREWCLQSMTTVKMKSLLRAAGLPIPKYKDEMLGRLAVSPRIDIQITATATATPPPDAR